MNTPWLLPIALAIRRTNLLGPPLSGAGSGYIETKRDKHERQDRSSSIFRCLDGADTSLTRVQHGDRRSRPKSSPKARPIVFRCLWAPAHTQRLRSSHQISPREQGNDGAVALNNHTERQRPSLAVGLGSVLLHGQLAMRQRGRKANRE